jgi:DNA polymerase-3 subunit delta'
MSVARGVAAALNCTSDARTVDDSCGECPSCLKVDKGTHPDVVTITIEKTVIPIESIRKLREEARFRPYEGSRRVFLIDPADRLSIAAQNALLKTLEEPSSPSCIILITSRLMSLLATTRSRCRILGFGTLRPERVAESLVSAHGFAPGDAERAARLSGGRFGAALALDLSLHDAARDDLIAVLGRLAERRARDHVIEDVDRLGDDAGETAARLDLMAGLVRDMMLLEAGSPAGELVHSDRADDLADLAHRLSPDLEILLERIRIAVSDLDHHVNRRVALETLLFDMAERELPTA